MENHTRTKDCEYNDYIKEHIENVNKAWCSVKTKLEGVYGLEDASYHNIEHRVKTHDISKFSITEFNGYREYFYPDEGEAQNKFHFEKAWLKHIHANDHHWNHWVICGDTTRALEMPFVCVFEMLLDWMSMSIKFGGTPRKYYDANKHKMTLHEETITVIESWIDLFK